MHLNLSEPQRPALLLLGPACWFQRTEQGLSQRMGSRPCRPFSAQQKLGEGVLSAGELLPRSCLHRQHQGSPGEAKPRQAPPSPVLAARAGSHLAGKSHVYEPKPTRGACYHEGNCPKCESTHEAGESDFDFQEQRVVALLCAMFQLVCLPITPK